MSQTIVDDLKTCKPGSLGSELFDTFTRWQKKAEIFLANCQCFLGEVKFSIQTQASAQLPHQIPVKTLSSPKTHPTTLEDKTPPPNITATKEKSTVLPPPYAEARMLLDALQKQMICHMSLLRNRIVVIFTLAQTPVAVIIGCHW